VLVPQEASTPIPLEIVAHATVAVFMGLLLWCLVHEWPDTPAQMEAIFQQLTLPGILAG
jgi:hypothetical protein